MSKDILVRLTIPISTEPGTTHSPLIFNRWLPSEEGDALIFNEDDLQLKIWLDINCIPAHIQTSECDISNWENVQVQKVFVDVLLKDVPDEVAAFISQGANHKYNAYLASEYERLGTRVVDVAIQRVNRLISYARNEKGQYWLRQHVFDPKNISSHCIEFNAKAQITTTGSAWFSWEPSHGGIMRLSMTMGPNLRYITREDWTNVKSFVVSNQRPDLVLELLSNADDLAAKGHSRSALIEAVTALEVEVARFSKSPKFQDILANDNVTRIDVDHFKTQVDHLGYSATLRYLLPLLFKESILPTNLLSECQQAIDIRGNVVHQGQRHIDETKLKQILRAIRETCSILKQYSNQNLVP